ncbi:MAG TPA: CDP-diacylglycerol--serine O-phosphatidyltransferase [Bryobacteraceae bacterium]|nr:CDP-diacylglycerol--serine O-phosphatidyltransferase [Bryobacteraceae bacterium]
MRNESRAEHAVKGLTLRERFIDPRSPDRRPRRAAYVLPTLFTSGNIFLGFLAILQSFQGAMQAQSGDLGSNWHFALAAKAIGFAVFFDGLDGRIARMTNTVSDFGRELDSIADVVTFGIAPAVLIFVWGVLFVIRPDDGQLYSHLLRAGYFVAFFFLLCGAVRLARFNVQTNPVPKNPGRPDRKHFVGMPIPAGAGFVAAVVYFFDSAPIRSFAYSIVWLVAAGIVALLMVSTWRYPSFKQLSVSKPRTPLVAIVLASIVLLIWFWSQPVLLLIASTYVLSGIVIRIGGIVRRRLRRPPTPLPEHQIG